MNPVLFSSGFTGNRMFSVPSSVIRGHRFLLSSLRGGSFCCLNRFADMAAAGTVTTPITEVDAGNIMRRITPVLDSTKHKGQAATPNATFWTLHDIDNGRKIAVIGGCREYTGAPYFSAISALKIGADLSHVFCTKDAAPVIKSYSPELIVHPIFEESYYIKDTERELISSRIIDDIMKWMERFDCLVIGPGLGRDPFLLDCVSDIIKHARLANVPMVIDGDGLFLITNNLGLISGYPLTVLTPNINEYKRLVEKVWNCEVDNGTGLEQLLSLAKHIGVTILRKGMTDLISDSETVSVVDITGSPRRCGGQGDILSGSVAVFSAWARQSNQTLAGESKSSSNPMVLGSIAGSFLLRKAASLAFENRKRAALTTDIIEYLGKSMENICPAE